MQRWASSIVAGGLPSQSALHLCSPALSTASSIYKCNVSSCEAAAFESVPRAAAAVSRGTTPTRTAFINQERSLWPVGWRGFSGAAARGAAQPLLNFRPSSGAAPLPSIKTCPTLEALDAHIQRHGYKYSLRHVAAGLETLSSLSPPAAANTANAAPAPVPPRQAAAAASTPADAPAAPPDGGSAATDPRRAPSLSQPVAVAESQPVPGDGGGSGDAAGAPARPGVADCARRLAMLGRHQMKVEEADVVAMAQCIRGVAGLGLPLPARAQMALPFVRRLRDPAYFFGLRDQPAATLVALLAALSRLPLYRHVRPSDIAPIVQVLARLVASLTPQVATLSAEDACRTTVALVRLGCSPERREAELYLGFMRALADHISLVLVEGGLVAPHQAVRLLWAYAVVAPASCGPPAAADGGGGGGGPRPAPLAGSPKAAAAAAAAEAAAEAAGGDDAMGRMAAALCRVACRGLDSHPPLELVKLVYALPRLGAQREAEAVLPRVTPRLLLKLESLDAGALADVASSYHLARVHEPGLLQAIADQVLEIEERSPLTSKRVMGQLLACYGPGGSHDDPRLRELLRRASTERLAGADAEAGDLGGGGLAVAGGNALLGRPPVSRGRMQPPAGRRDHGRGAA